MKPGSIPSRVVKSQTEVTATKWPNQDSNPELKCWTHVAPQTPVCTHSPWESADFDSINMGWGPDGTTPLLCGPHSEEPGPLSQCAVG